MDPLPEPANLAFLRRLVTVLTAVMIVGVVTTVGLLVIRLQPRDRPLPETITLPNGTVASAFTIGSDWYAVVTTDDQILIFDKVTGVLRQTITLD